MNYTLIESLRFLCVVRSTVINDFARKYSDGNKRAAGSHDRRAQPDDHLLPAR